ncbi:hypothetical protein C8A00DRAFT_18740 [Chaetomidium leptoderma]|uniref:Mating-type switching protein swi10 n=1 Tax=Chaetomidium leptoderma TaxID=669021 RepID=A0AAN6VDX1_9PEZI|nr:hypothetical protein C8A00DRAFT_18740 [Chaetomidium leptoderma]
MEQGKEGLLATSPAKAPRLRRKLQKSLRQQPSSIASRFGSSASNQALPRKTCDTTDSKPTTPQAQQSPSASDSTAPTRPKMRRRAKTPVLSIGQLEDIPRQGRGLSRTSSVDLIAEQYKAILEVQRSSPYSDDNHSDEPPLSHQEIDIDELVMLRRRRSSNSLPGQTSSGDSTRMVGLANLSPTSDDGTLVSFQEEAVYFKPVSFSPEPESPILPLSQPQTTTHDYNDDDDDNVGLQICLDLLTRELSSAIAGRPCRSSVDTSALQVLAMIEAYERLRDQMAELSSGNEQARSLEMMFDMWLRALHSIHHSMTGGQGVGDNDYGAELGTEELD